MIPPAPSRPILPRGRGAGAAPLPHHARAPPQKLATIAICYLLLFYACGIFAPLIAPYGLNEQNSRPRRSASHQRANTSLGPTGWDAICSRASSTPPARRSFTVILFITGGLFLGLGLGLLAGYKVA